MLQQTFDRALETGLPMPRRGWAIATIVVTIVMTVSASTIANIALPTIAKDLGETPASVIWLINAFQLAVVVSLLPLASFGESVGYRRILQGGIVLFVLGSAICACTDALAPLIAARALQGVGAAGTLSVMGALVRHTYPRSHLGRGIALNTFTVAIASACGPIAGSAILEVAPWEWLFAINIPIGFVALLLSRALPLNPLVKRRFDRLGGVLNALTFGGFVIGMNQINAHPVLAAASLTTAALSGVFLVRHETRIDRPLLPLDLLATPRLAFAATGSVFSFAASITSLVSLPFYFSHDFARPQIEVGLLMAVWPLAIAPASLIAGRLSDRYREESLCLIGTLIMSGGLFWMLLQPVDAGNLGLAVGLALAGFGFAFFQTPNNRVLLGSAPLERSGGASGLQSMSRELGFASGAGILGLVFELLADAGASAGLMLAISYALIASGVNVMRACRELS